MVLQSVYGKKVFCLWTQNKHGIAREWGQILIKIKDLKQNFIIGESTMWSFRHCMTTNWSTMAAGAQMERVKLEEFNLKGMKSTED